MTPSNSRSSFTSVSREISCGIEIGLQHLGHELGVAFGEDPVFHAFFDHGGNSDAFERDQFVHKNRTLARENFRHFQDFRVVREHLEVVAHAFQQHFLQPFIGCPILAAADLRHRRVFLGVVLARHGLGDVDLGFEEAINVARRHVAIGSDLGHGCLAVAVVLDAGHRGLKNAVAGSGFLVHPYWIRGFY